MKAAILIPVLVGKDAVGSDAMAMARLLGGRLATSRVKRLIADSRIGRRDDL